MHKKQISPYLSEKIRILSFFAIIGVLMIHTTYTETSNWHNFWMVQKFISSLSNCAVPFFFMVSGYFFFYKIEGYKDILKGISHRFNTLLLPYFFWCITFMVVVGIIGNVITLNNDYYVLLREGDIAGFLTYCFWTPAAFHLWYVRDLFIVVLLCPVIFIPLKRWPWATLVIAYVAFGFFQIIPMISWALWWFIFGASFGIRRVPLLFSLRPSIACILLLTGCITVFVLIYKGHPLTPEYKYTIPVILTCILGIWGVYDALTPKMTWILGLTDFTFVIYCAHIPLLNVLKKMFYPMLDSSIFGCVLGYVLSPAITIGIIFILFYFMKKYFPCGYSFITGGR